jgi:MYXO-CTERM domain-containing protein
MSKPKRSISRNRSLAARLPRYAAAGAAAAALPAPADIIYVNNAPVTVNSVQTPVLWSIDGGGHGFNFDYQHSVGQHTIQVGQSGPFERLVTATTHGQALLPIAAGQTIGTVLPAHGAFQANGAAAILTHNGAGWSPLATGTQYIGFEFGATVGTPQFGWAEVTVAAGSATIDSWAYQSSPNVPIQAGQVPEPASSAAGLGLLALGAAGVSAYKRRRQKTA